MFPAQRLQAECLFVVSKPVGRVLVLSRVQDPGCPSGKMLNSWLSRKLRRKTLNYHYQEKKERSEKDWTEPDSALDILNWDEPRVATRPALRASSSASTLLVHMRGSCRNKQQAPGSGKGVAASEMCKACRQASWRRQHLPQDWEAGLDCEILGKLGTGWVGEQRES